MVCSGAPARSLFVDGRTACLLKPPDAKSPRLAVEAIARMGRKVWTIP